MFQQQAGEIFQDFYQKIRAAFLREFESEFFARLKSKPNWSVDQIREVFEETKDRI